MNYRCDDCGRGYRSLHNIESDLTKKKIMEIENNCPACGITMSKNHNVMDEIPHNINSQGSYTFLGHEIVSIQDNKMLININNLLTIGYGGILEIQWKRNLGRYLIDPINNRIKKV